MIKRKISMVFEDTDEGTLQFSLVGDIERLIDENKPKLEELTAAEFWAYKLFPFCQSVLEKADKQAVELKPDTQREIDE